MKKRLQGFGIGLFLAGAAITLLSQFTDFEQTKDNEEITKLQNQLQAAEQEIATLNEAVAQASLHTEQTEPAEEPAQSEEAAATEEQEDSASTQKEADADKQPSDKEETAHKTGTILVYEGVSLYDIGKQAEDQGIIENGRELELYLSKPEYARSIQKGQFELTADMSLEEMARLLTGKR